MVRIICIGNRFYYPDDFGIAVYEELLKRELGSDIEVVEGGVGGMNLILYFEDEADIVIVDYGISDKKIVTPKDIALMDLNEFNHANAFLYLLKSITKEYTIYLCNEHYDKNQISHYADEVMSLARSFLCK